MQRGADKQAVGARKFYGGQFLAPYWQIDTLQQFLHPILNKREWSGGKFIGGIEKWSNEAMRGGVVEHSNLERSKEEGEVKQSSAERR